MICFQIARMDTTTRAVAVVSSVVTVHGERPPAIYTPDTVHPVNLGGVHLFVSNVTPFASPSSFLSPIIRVSFHRHDKLVSCKQHRQPVWHVYDVTHTALAIREAKWPRGLHPDIHWLVLCTAMARV